MFMIRLPAQQFRTNVTGSAVVSGRQPEGHRAIIDQPNLHVGAESPAFDALDLAAAMLHQQAKIIRGFFWRGGFAEARASAFSSVGDKRELWHQQQPGRLILNAAIHAARRVSKYPVSEDAFGESLYITRRVVAVHGNEHHEAAGDLSDDLTLDTDVCASHPL